MSMAEEVQTIQAGGPAVALTSSPAVGAGPLERVYAFWLAGMSCDGCIISVTGASEPSLEDLLLGNVPGLPRLILYHPALALEAGEEFIRNYELAASGKLDAPYVIILEGSAVDDSLIVGEGYWAGRGWLTHHLELDKGAIVNYQIVTPRL
jgi:hydrogenase small subunit